MSNPMQRAERLPTPEQLEQYSRALVSACTYMNALRAGLPMQARPGAGTARELRPSFDRWEAILAAAGAEPLPPPRVASDTPGSESYAVISGEVGQDVPTPDSPFSTEDAGELRQRGERQGAALARWIAERTEEVRARARRVADAFGETVREVRRRASRLRGETVESVRSFLNRWTEGAMGIHRDMMDALAQAAWGAGVVLGLAALAYIMLNKRGNR